jgi:hypothetical protein
LGLLPFIVGPKEKAINACLKSREMAGKTGAGGGD